MVNNQQSEPWPSYGCWRVGRTPGAVDSLPGRRPATTTTTLVNILIVAFDVVVVCVPTVCSGRARDGSSKQRQLAAAAAVLSYHDNTAVSRVCVWCR